MTPPGWLVSASDWPFKAAVDLSNWLGTLQLPQLTWDCSQMCNKIQFGLVLCEDVPTLHCTLKKIIQCTLAKGILIVASVHCAMGNFSNVHWVTAIAKRKMGPLYHLVMTKS